MSTRKIIIIGAGGHAKVARAALESQGLAVAGWVDPAFAAGTDIDGVPIAGNDAWLYAQSADEYAVVIGVGVQRASVVRQELFNQVKSCGFDCPQVIHADSHVDATAQIAEAVQIMAGAIVQAAVVLSENVIVNSGAIVEHDCHIGSHVHIATGATLGGTVRVGDRSLVGLGSRILPGVTIGSDVTVGAGAVVVRDIPDGVTVVGVPAQPIVRSNT